MSNNDGLILPYLPENLESLNKEERDIRTQAILHINSEEILKDHLDIVYASLDMIMDMTGHKSQSEDEQIIQYLGARLFNSIVSALNQALSGYYQGSFIFLRDILETGFLLDYFTIDKSKIADWRDCTDRERYNKYKPGIIRKALDDRDGFEGKKRGKVYQIMCEYAAHPTYPGFTLLAPDGYVKTGPFFNEKYLKSAIEDLAKYVPNFVVIYISHFKNRSPQILRADMDFLDKIKEWAKKYRGMDLSHYNTDEIRQLLRGL